MDNFCLMTDGELIYLGPKHDQKKKVLMNLSEVTDVLSFYHSTPVGGHSGVNTTLSKISQNYAWNGMKEDVVEYVSKSYGCLYVI